jgi:tetratricopeptide (TPR) repeat protein
MLYRILILSLSISLVGSAYGHPLQTRQSSPQPQPVEQAGFIAPSAVNVRIEADARTFVVMAAVNVAGFDYETAGLPLTPARVELRKDLAKVDPAIRAKLAEFYKSHRPPGIDEAAYAARYAALSLLMTPPPAFTVFQPEGSPIPPDLQQLAKFADLVREFYLASGIRELIPKYTEKADVYAKAYYRPVGETVYSVLEYFHTMPETVINMRPLVIQSNDPNSRKSKEKVVSRNRTRQVFVIPDPLAALDTAYVRGDILNQKEDLLSRRVGDDYIVIVGPSKAPNTEAVRQAVIRFVIDPLVERHLKNALEYRDDIVKLVGAIPTASKEYSTSVYLVIRESLAQAAEARLRRIRSIKTRGSYGEDDATYDLAQAYLRGAALAFHFYESLKGYEQVGINIEDFFDQMIATTKFERESKRAQEFEAVVAKVAAARATKKVASVEPAPAIAGAGAMARKIILSDDLIRERRYSEARPILQEILAAEPNNARALYGMARVLNQMQSPVESDPKADENDKIQAQHERLNQAMKLYQKAIDNASREGELWLIQWGHVYMGRIYDFQEFRNDAIAEYEKAIALGDKIPNGAYKEAVEGKQRPYGQR